MPKPQKKRYLTAGERITQEIKEWADVHLSWLEAVRCATNTQEAMIARYRADEVQAKIDALCRKRRKLENKGHRYTQGKIF